MKLLNNYNNLTGCVVDVYNDYICKPIFEQYCYQGLLYGISDELGPCMIQWTHWHQQTIYNCFGDHPKQCDENTFEDFFLPKMYILAYKIYKIYQQIIFQQSVKLYPKAVNHDSKDIANLNMKL